MLLDKFVLSMSKIYRINQGKILLGVCNGLGASGGSVILWRLIFVFSSLFLFFPILVYIILGFALPAQKPRKDITINQGLGSDLNIIELDLEKILDMKDKKLINDEEYEKLRQKILDK